MKTRYEKNVESIEAGGGFAVRSWIESDKGESGGGATRGGVKRHFEGAPRSYAQAESAFEKRDDWDGRHAVVYGLGDGNHIEAAADAVGENGAVTVIECSSGQARRALEETDFERLAGRPNVMFLIGPGSEIVPFVMSRVRLMELPDEKIRTKLYVHGQAIAALPRQEHAIREFLGRLRDGFYFDGSEGDPLIRLSIYAIRKKMLIGDTLTDLETAILFAESVLREGRFFFYDAAYEKAALPQTVRRLLLISLSAIGDVVMTSAVFPGFREKYPGAQITLLTENPNESLYKRSRSIDRVVGYSRRGIIREFLDEPSWETLMAGCGRFLQLAGELRGEEFDAVANLHLSARSAIIAGAAGPAGAAGIGYRVGSDGAAVVRGNVWMLARLSENIPLDMPVEENHIRVFGLEPSVRRTDVTIPGEGEPWVWPRAAGNSPRGRAVGINPFVSKPVRNWGAEKFLQLGKIITTEMDRDVVVFAGDDAGEQELAKKLCEEIDRRAVPCAGGPPDRYAWTARECALFITNDTGPMHFSASAGARCLVISGPTLTLPYGPLAHIGISAVVPCAGCGPANICEKKSCFEAVTPAQVAAVASLMLEKGHEGSIAALAGNISDGAMPHRILTTGTRASLTPGFLIRVRDAVPHELIIASEFAKIAVFNIISVLESGASRLDARPAAFDRPGLASPFSPETAAKEVLLRYSFVSPDMERIKHYLDNDISLLHLPAMLYDPLEAIGYSHLKYPAVSACREFVSSVRGFL